MNPPIVRAVTDDAQRRSLAERHVDRAFQAIADVAALQDVDVAFDRAFHGVDVRLVGDVADRAADAARAEQGALRAAKRLDAVQVEQIEVRREQRERSDRFVEIDADLFLHARLVAGDLAGRDAAH